VVGGVSEEGVAVLPEAASVAAVGEAGRVTKIIQRGKNEENLFPFFPQRRGEVVNLVLEFLGRNRKDVRKEVHAR